MATEEKKVRVTVEAETGQSARQVDAVADSLTGLADGARAAGDGSTRAADGLQAMARRGQEGAQRLQGVASAVQSLVSAFGSSDRTAGLVASVAGATAQFAAMGSMVGPGGALVGGLAGLVVGLRQVVSANNDVADSARRAREQLAQLATQRLADCAAANLDRDIASGNISDATSVDDLRREREERRIQLEGIEADFDEFAARRRRLLELAGGDLPEGVDRTHARDLARIRRQRQRLLAEIGNIDEETVGRGGTLGGGATYDGTAPGGGGESGMSAMERSWRDDVEAAQALAAEEGRIRGYWLSVERDEEAAQEAFLDDLRAQRLDREEAARATAADQAAAWREFEIEEAERAAEEAEQIQIDFADRRRQLDEQALADREASASELTGMFGDISMSFGKTLGAIATGEKTAEEAFKGLAAAFLEMISQYATMKAGTEFADAAASFARYDFGGGAAHIGAGLAFTAVAVATGVGAAAINSAPAAPARPEAGAAANDGGYSPTVVINWNAPVYTSTQRAEMGRELSTLVGEGMAA